MTAIEMFNLYLTYSATTNFIVGAVIGSTVKFAFVDSSMLTNALTTSTGSSKERASTTLRLLVSKDLKAYIKNNGTELTTKEHFETIAKEVGGNGRSNRGLALEKLITEYFGQEWKADSKCFTECGDININGVEYQIKGHKATFTNEEKLRELVK